MQFYLSKNDVLQKIKKMLSLPRKHCLASKIPYYINKNPRNIAKICKNEGIVASNCTVTAYWKMSGTGEPPLSPAQLTPWQKF